MAENLNVSACCCVFWVCLLTVHKQMKMSMLDKRSKETTGGAQLDRFRCDLPTNYDSVAASKLPPQRLRSVAQVKPNTQIQVSITENGHHSHSTISHSGIT